MPDDGGSRAGASRLAFTRRALQRTSCYRREEHAGVNPHTFYRVLRARLDALRAEQGPGFEVVGERERELDVSCEAIGEHTGVVTGRLQARSEVPAIPDARLRYRPWGPHGALLAIAGGVLAVFAPLHVSLLAIGALLLLLGAWLFRQTEEGKIPLRRRDVVSVLVEGEAHETAPEGEAGRSALAAELSVHYGAESFLVVDASRVAGRPWPLRSELLERRRAWRRHLDGASRQQVVLAKDEPMDFAEALKAWTQLDGAWTRREIERWQRDLRPSLSERQAYTRLLSQLRVANVRRSELDRLEADVATLRAEMEAYANGSTPPRHPRLEDGETNGSADPASRPHEYRARFLSRPPPRTVLDRATEEPPGSGNGDTPQARERNGD